MDANVLVKEAWLEVEHKAWLLFYPHFTSARWTLTRLKSNKITLQLCWGRHFLQPFIMWMSLSKGIQIRAEVWLLGSWQYWSGGIYSTDHITVPLQNMGLGTVVSLSLLQPAFWTLESTMNWCKVTGCPHLTIRTGVQDPRGPVKGPNGRHNQAVLSTPWLNS